MALELVAMSCGFKMSCALEGNGSEWMQENGGYSARGVCVGAGVQLEILWWVCARSKRGCG